MCMHKFTVYKVHCRVYSVECTLCNVQFKLYNIHDIKSTKYFNIPGLEYKQRSQRLRPLCR